MERKYIHCCRGVGEGGEEKPTPGTEGVWCFTQKCMIIKKKLSYKGDSVTDILVGQQFHSTNILS